MSKLSHVRPDGSVHMVDVAGKAASVRVATARGLLRIQPTHRKALGALEKGDAFVTAQIAGIQGGKRCSELIPLCHPLSLSKLDVSIALIESGIQIEATAKTEAQTGVEMEAYTAVVVAGITLIDMLKGVDPDLTLTDVQLVSKSGGKTVATRIGILTVSDTRDPSTDQSGPMAIQCLRSQGYAEFDSAICKDVVADIQAEILRLCETCRAVFTTGGTGFSHRDVTPEATIPLLDRRADNLCELTRVKGLEQTPLSYLSRAVAGVRGDVLIVNLPGAPNAVRHGLMVLAPLLKPILQALEATNTAGETQKPDAPPESVQSEETAEDQPDPEGSNYSWF